MSTALGEFCAIRTKIESVGWLCAILHRSLSTSWPNRSTVDSWDMCAPVVRPTAKITFELHQGCQIGHIFTSTFALIRRITQNVILLYVHSIRLEDILKKITWHPSDGSTSYYKGRSKLAVRFRKFYKHKLAHDSSTCSRKTKLSRKILMNGGLQFISERAWMTAN